MLSLGLGLKTEFFRLGLQLYGLGFGLVTSVLGIELCGLD